MTLLKRLTYLQPFMVKQIFVLRKRILTRNIIHILLNNSPLLKKIDAQVNFTEKCDCFFARDFQPIMTSIKDLLANMKNCIRKSPSVRIAMFTAKNDIVKWHQYYQPGFSTRNVIQFQQFTSNILKRRTFLLQIDFLYIKRKCQFRVGNTDFRTAVEHKAFDRFIQIYYYYCNLLNKHGKASKRLTNCETSESTCEIWFLNFTIFTGCQFLKCNFDGSQAALWHWLIIYKATNNQTIWDFPHLHLQSL